MVPPQFDMCYAVGIYVTIPCLPICVNDPIDTTCAKTATPKTTIPTWYNYGERYSTTHMFVAPDIDTTASTCTALLWIQGQVMLRLSTFPMGSTHSAIPQRSRSSCRLSLHKLRRKTDDPISRDDPRQVRDQAREIRTARRLATYMEDHSTTKKIHVHVDLCYERFIGIDLVDMLYFAYPVYVPQLGHIYVAHSSDSLMDDKVTEDTVHDGETVVDTADMKKRIYFPMVSIAG